MTMLLRLRYMDTEIEGRFGILEPIRWPFRYSLDDSVAVSVFSGRFGGRFGTVLLITEKDRKGPKRTEKGRKGPKRAEKDRKEPKRTKNNLIKRAEKNWIDPKRTIIETKIWIIFTQELI